MTKKGVDLSKGISTGPILPYHLAEARRRLMDSGEFVSDKPKNMFLRKWRCRILISICN